MNDMRIRESISLICDDIRTELGQKLSIMGVYGSSLSTDDDVAKLPRLFLYKRVITDESITASVELDLIGPNGESLLRPADRPRINEAVLTNETNLALGVGPLSLAEPGKYRFVLHFTPNRGDPFTLEHGFTLEIKPATPK